MFDTSAQRITLVPFVVRLFFDGDRLVKVLLPFINFVSAFAPWVGSLLKERSRCVNRLRDSMAFLDLLMMA